MMRNHRQADAHTDDVVVEEAIQNYLHSDNFKIKSYSIRPASDDLMGFLGDHWKIKVEYIFKANLYTVSFFYKTLPKDNEFKTDFNKRYRLFDREIYFHKSVFSQFKKRDDERQCMPRCFYAKFDEMVFEDLHVKGFQMSELRKPMDIHHARAVMRSLATFHASCFIFEETKSLELNKIYRLDEEYQDDFEGGCFFKGKWYGTARRIALILLGNSTKYGKDTIYYQKAVAKWSQLDNQAIELITDPAEEGRNIIAHMDLWNNNIMFKYDKAGLPIQCMFVDYQGCKLTKPAADIVAYIYLCLDKKLRDQIFDDLVDYYYDEMKQVLKESNINIDDIMSLKELRMSCEEYRLWGLVHSQSIFQFFFMDEDDKMSTATDSEAFHRLINVDRSEELFKSFSHNLDYKERMMDVLDEMVERYIV